MDVPGGKDGLGEGSSVHFTRRYPSGTSRLGGSIVRPAAGFSPVPSRSLLWQAVTLACSFCSPRMADPRKTIPIHACLTGWLAAGLSLCSLGPGERAVAVELNSWQGARLSLKMINDVSLQETHQPHFCLLLRSLGPC